MHCIIYNEAGVRISVIPIIHFKGGISSHYTTRQKKTYVLYFEYIKIKLEFWEIIVYVLFLFTFPLQVEGGIDPLGLIGLWPGYQVFKKKTLKRNIINLKEEFYFYHPTNYSHVLCVFHFTVPLLK
jgi:hypothetical protein